MINFGTLTFVLKCLTDSDSEGRNHSIRTCKRKQKNIQSASEDVVLIRRSSASACSEDLPRSFRRLRTESSDEQSQPLKIVLLIKCLKFLKTEVLMNVSSIQDLKTLKNQAPKKSEDQKF